MIGYIDGKAVCSDEVKTSGTLKSLSIVPSRDFIYADCDDAIAFNITGVDENGIPVPTAGNLIRFSVEGGEILGVGNGDPNSHEADKADRRKLFNSLCQVIVKQNDGEKAVTLIAEADGISPAEFTVPTKERDTKITYVKSVTEKYVSTWRMTVSLSKERPDPNVKIEDNDMNTWAVITAGHGFDEAFDGNTGYALYKTAAEISDSDTTLIFKDISGTSAEIFINGKEVFSDKCAWGNKIQIPLNGISGKCEIAVIIYSENANDNGGITKPVVIV